MIRGRPIAGALPQLTADESKNYFIAAGSKSV
jgi:hypothetical protein